MASSSAPNCFSLSCSSSRSSSSLSPEATSIMSLSEAGRSAHKRRSTTPCTLQSRRACSGVLGESPAVLCIQALPLSHLDIEQIGQLVEPLLAKPAEQAFLRLAGETMRRRDADLEQLADRLERLRGGRIAFGAFARAGQ